MAITECSPDRLKQCIKNGLAWLSVPAVLSFVVGCVTSIWPFSVLLLFPLAIPILTGWAVSFLMKTVRLAWKKDVAASLAFLCVFAISLPAMKVCFQAGDYVHVAVLYPHYLSKISDPVNNPSPIDFPWDSSGMPGSSQLERTLEYDGSDRLMQNVGSIKVQENPEIWETTRHLIGHFYLFETVYN
ncbi:MAG: hypothetical protein WCD70_05405 [Alphaproteobacteria bacterium]